LQQHTATLRNRLQHKKPIKEPFQRLLHSFRDGCIASKEAYRALEHALSQSPLFGVAVSYTVMRSVAVCCSVLQCVAVCCSVMHRVTVCCSVVYSVAARCSVLQCIAVCCYQGTWTSSWGRQEGACVSWMSHCLNARSVSGGLLPCCSVLQYVAVCCIVLQCVAGLSGARGLRLSPTY